MAVLLTVCSATGEVDQVFRLDTRSDVTTLTEDVAAACGLPGGGAPLSVSGVSGPVVGRVVDVRYRFPPDAVSGTNGIEVDSRWVVVPSRTDLALLSLADIHRHFSIGTDDANMYFAER